MQKPLPCVHTNSGCSFMLVLEKGESYNVMAVFLKGRMTLSAGVNIRVGVDGMPSASKRFSGSLVFIRNLRQEDC